MKRVFLDPGYGGKDPSAIGNGLQEKDINLSVALKIGDILKRHNVETIYSRITDTFVELSERSSMANKNNSNIFVSIHVNAADNINAKGVETFNYPGSSNGANLAKNIQEQLVADKIFTANRGTKAANFAVLGLTKMPSVLVELGFISNPEDAKILRIKQLKMAESVAKGILRNLGVKYIENNHSKETGTNILGNATATVEQMKECAKSKNAHQNFIELAALFHEISEKAGVNPIITYTQSAKETRYMNFGGVLDITYNNPCGMKNSSGGGDYDPSAHKRFSSWQEGIKAQVDHLALYAGAEGYPKADTRHPRHFSYLKGAAKTVEGLGGKWAPSKTYGNDIVEMMKELEDVKVNTEGKLEIIKISLHGQEIEIEGIKHNKTNYIPIRFLEKLGYEVGWNDKKKIVTVKYKEVK